MKIPVIKKIINEKCNCGCEDWQIIDWSPDIIIICRKCCKRLDNKNFKIEYVEMGE